ncbi:MAG: hypothetical protein E7207_04940 [Clostridium butyricum]|nr:hypothetical protein [Clostridium butyricum]
MSINLKKEEKNILLGIPFIFLLSIPLHFAYEFSGSNPIIGIFTPVNESIWEHLKLSFYPMLIWWFISFLVLEKCCKLSAENWFSACVFSLIGSPIIITSLYYINTCGFSLHSLILDIFSLFIGIFLGQILALHIYTHKKFNIYDLYSSISIILIIILLFTFFTFCPPNYPIFIEK